MNRGAGVAVAVVAWGLAGTASADEGYLQRLADKVRARIDAIVAAKGPKQPPPTPITVQWKVARVGTVELGAPLIALVAGELDGDRKTGELYAVTPREVVALGFRGGHVVELGRVAFSGEPAVPAPRDPVGSAVIDGNELVAAASPWASELRVSWRGKTLVGKPGASGFGVCKGERLQLAPGRNHFANGAYAIKCRDDLVDNAGYGLTVRAELSTTNKLEVVVKRCVADQCSESGRFEYAKIGVAFDIADVDRDGTPELIVAEANPPGLPDAAKVITLGGDDKRGIFRRPFAGGVAGLAVVDGDDPDDVPEVVAAVRLVGSTRVDIWRLD